MREIKLRAWQKEPTKSWVRRMWQDDELICIDFFNRDITVKDFEDGYGERDLRFEEVEIMQFTGLKDKHGKEIYEGDIVRSSRRGVNTIESVEYVSGGFTPYSIAGWEFVAEPDESEVIGNRYENPELLEVERESQ